VTEIVRFLNKCGLPAQGISSNFEQDQREEVVRSFRSKKIRILVATDVMSRGIDVKEINLVINFDVPHDAEDYVHRIGRTARINATGEAITLVTQKEIYRLKNIERLIKSEVPKLKPSDEFGPVPSWDETTERKKEGGKRKFNSFRRRPSGKRRGGPEKKSS
jgi:superfamily II DNA/RNA helicase